MYKEVIQDVLRRNKMYTKLSRMYKEGIQDVYRRNRMYNKGIQDVQRSYIGCIKKEQDVLQYNKGIQNV